MRIGVADQPVASSEEQGQFIAGSEDRPVSTAKMCSARSRVAVPDRVEPGVRAEHGEPRRPHVRGDQEAAGTAGQRDLQQVAGVQAQDRPAVGGQVADLGQRRGDPVRGLEARRVEQMVHLPGALVPPVDGRDFDREHEPDRARRRPPGLSRHQPLLQLGPDPEQAGLGRDQRFAQLRRPGRMGEVAGAEHGQALAQRPPGQMLDIAVLAARTENCE